MTIKQAYNILKRHNKWRRGADIKMTNPLKLGIAIETVLTYLELKLDE